jgi:hypothetical protein
MHSAKWRLNPIERQIYHYQYDNIVQIDDRVMSRTISGSTNYIAIMITYLSTLNLPKQLNQRLVIFMIIHFFFCYKTTK